LVGGSLHRRGATAGSKPRELLFDGSHLGLRLCQALAHALAVCTGRVDGGRSSSLGLGEAVNYCRGGLLFHARSDERLPCSVHLGHEAVHVPGFCTCRR
jgi:hypothetical protein